MHVLRSTYLPAYAALIRPPYTSDPFPHGLSGLSATPSYQSSESATASLLPTQCMQRETRVLDLFIALKVREDVWADESELHLEREESFKDLFDLMQPRARVEDLVRTYGVRDGSVAIPLPSGATPVATTPVATSFPTSFPGSSSSSSGKDGKEPLASGSAQPARSSRYTYTYCPLPFAVLTVSFSPRAVGLVLTTRERKRKIVEVSRTREEALETSAKKLVRELRGWIAVNPSHGVR